MLDAKVVTCAVRREARALYDMLWHPESFPRWASGLSGGGLASDGEVWRAMGPEGPVTIRFTPRNDLGVMDHWVDLGDGRVVFVPLRIVPNQEGSEVMLTLFRLPDMSPERFAADEAWVRRDLAALKALAEGA
ncbi:polyketide cyclase [Methylobacterium sp. JK268]